MEIEKHIEELKKEFPDVEKESIRERLKKLLEYDVPIEKAKDTVRSNYKSRNSKPESQSLQTQISETKIEDIDEDGEWIDITCKVIELWESKNDSIDQTGLIGDETGTIKFTKWAKSDLPKLEEGDVYKLKDVITDEYQGRYSIELNSSTYIDRLEKDIEVGKETSKIKGALVAIQEGSGLIKRCPECGRPVEKRCSTHNREGEFDLRTKAVIDNGKRFEEAIFDEEKTEELTDIDLEKAKEIEISEGSKVIEKIKEKLGNYYSIEGRKMDPYLLVDKVEKISEPMDLKETLERAKNQTQTQKQN